MKPDMPLVFDYHSVQSFLNDRYRWLRQHARNYSVRGALRQVENCSPALITQILHGQRRLTRDKIPAVAQVFRLSKEEERYLDNWLSRQNLVKDKISCSDQKTTLPRSTDNSILKNPLHVYIKDASQIEGFKPCPDTIFRLLRGLASKDQIAKSLLFLQKNGFATINAAGHWQLNRALTVTTSEIPTKLIRNFHKKALKIALLGLEKFSVKHRQAYALTLALDEHEFCKLKQKVRDFYQDLQSFSEETKEVSSRTKAGLYQVIIHVTPIGGQVDDSNPTA